MAFLRKLFKKSATQPTDNVESSDSSSEDPRSSDQPEPETMAFQQHASEHSKRYVVSVLTAAYQALRDCCILQTPHADSAPIVECDLWDYFTESYDSVIPRSCEIPEILQDALDDSEEGLPIKSIETLADYILAAQSVCHNLLFLACANQMALSEKNIAGIHVYLANLKKISIIFEQSFRESKRQLGVVISISTPAKEMVVAREAHPEYTATTTGKTLHYPVIHIQRDYKARQDDMQYLAKIKNGSIVHIAGYELSDMPPGIHALGGDYCSQTSLELDKQPVQYGAHNINRLIADNSVLRAGDSITIALWGCRGGEGQKNSIAAEVARFFLDRGIHSTVIASITEVMRFTGEFEHGKDQYNRLRYKTETDAIRIFIGNKAGIFEFIVDAPIYFTQLGVEEYHPVLANHFEKTFLSCIELGDYDGIGEALRAFDAESKIIANQYDALHTAFNRRHFGIIQLFLRFSAVFDYAATKPQFRDCIDKFITTDIQTMNLTPSSDRASSDKYLRYLQLLIKRDGSDNLQALFQHFQAVTAQQINQLHLAASEKPTASSQITSPYNMAQAPQRLFHLAPKQSASASSPTERRSVAVFSQSTLV
ncbi:MAG: hypothetical protein A3F43_05350 [Gammaproteobacteria bacterium RIFCSPHIGHO2_12_FULL_42_10]|nr:MAG: hypothetical protein A3F43_05350 [Gammaproteobacteria bacterium RIFCSPHIGHO2_12_FULL_42_10]